MEQIHMQMGRKRWNVAWMNSESKTFVLVHGAFHGGWCWKKVVASLSSQGATVYAPSLSGLADRAHLLTPSIRLETHVQDIVGLFEYEDLKDVVLVGHSYGGMVITSAAERLVKRLAHIVYLDAAFPERGNQCMYDLFPESFRNEDEEWMKQNDETWKLPPDPESTFGVEDEDDLRWLRSKLTAHPFKTLADASMITDDFACSSKPPRIYIFCEMRVASPFRPFAERAQALGWRCLKLNTGHDAMITMPDKLVQFLNKI
jgi:pimeloyl-ACP methyl ester carboxylesterase